MFLYSSKIQWLESYWDKMVLGKHCDRGLDPNINWIHLLTKDHFPSLFTHDLLSTDSTQDFWEIWICILVHLMKQHKHLMFAMIMWWVNNCITYLCGMVFLKISNIQVQVLSQASLVNLVPLDMTRFSKQFVPDRASCSLSKSQVSLISNANKTIHIHLHVYSFYLQNCSLQASKTQ